MTRYCTKCGAINDDLAQYCSNCQSPLSPVVGGYQPMQAVNPGAIADWKSLGADKKIVAGICGILWEDSAFTNSFWDIQLKVSSR